MDISKYARGTVWFYKSPKTTKEKGVQAFSRPVLIISNNKFNNYSPVVNVLFLTTKPKSNPAHIKLNVTGSNNTSDMINLQNSYILIEQIATINIHNLSDYLFTVSDAIMSKVEEILKWHLGLTITEEQGDNANPIKQDTKALNINQELNVNQELNINPELNNNPKPNNSSELNINPEVNISPELNTSQAEKDAEKSEVNLINCDNQFVNTILKDKLDEVKDQLKVKKHNHYTKKDYDWIMKNYPHNIDKIQKKYNKSSKQNTLKMISYLKSKYGKNN